MPGDESRTRALCCVCGNLRTVSANYNCRLDDNYSMELDGTYEDGWRCTGTLKCVQCRAMTRHAPLRNDPWRDFAELHEEQRHAAIRARQPPGGHGQP